MHLRPAQQKLYDDVVKRLKRDRVTDDLSIKRAIKDVLVKNPQNPDTAADIWNTFPTMIRKHLTSPE